MSDPDPVETVLAAIKLDAASSMLPPNARAGECYARLFVPAEHAFGCMVAFEQG